MRELVNRIVNFVEQNYEPYRGQKERLRQVITQHLIYKTFDWVEEDGEIVACMRYNVLGDTARILDLIIKSERRNSKLLQKLALSNWVTWPHLKYFEFRRFTKNPRLRKYRLDRLIKRR